MYEAKNLDPLLGTPGLSDELLKNHFTLYQGYVTNTNKVSDTLALMVTEGKAGTPEYNELKRRFGWEYNGMRLHELYFDNLKNGGATLNPESLLMTKIGDEFGSLENWEKDFRSTGTIRGIGWVVLYYDPTDERLFNCWVDEHNIGHLTGANPILVMDVFEHAFMLDYGLKRADYIETFFKNIDWERAIARMG
ncbi:MAG: Fe-Mn family superoxide dismutase [Candidatus Magasanikbacteria bacterium]|nr:Fe-Mn family superoxide dismutase [Candidatus Magasanikbacteria bacterium]